MATLNNESKSPGPELYSVPSKMAENAHINAQKYQEMYQHSMEDPESFWAEAAGRLDWFTVPTKIKDTKFTRPVHIKWYEDGVLNACHNCVDRHLPELAAKTALIWEGDNPSDSKHISYAELKDEVCRLANALKARGIGKGDRVTIYMPMICEAVYAMLACARIGAVHSVVFGGFSPESLKGRIQDCDARLVITADEAVRGGKIIPLKANTDEAVKDCPNVETVLVYRRTGGDIDWQEGHDIWWHDLVPAQDTDCPCEEMNAEDPLFILYTSGSTGKPKGVLHTTGGYMVYASLTHEYVFDYRPDEVYWCTADVGWVTGHSYIVYGPLANAATSLVFEGVPNYPDASRCWQVVDKHKVNSFYTAPTAIRALLREGDEPLASSKRDSLRVLGTVGEPINHEAWLWYYHKVGHGRCPIVDTWWQTETGGHILTPLPGATNLKPGSATLPFFGICPSLVDNNNKPLEGEAQGALCFDDSWPGQMRSLYGNHQRFEETYFTAYPGRYFSGDGARRDADGYYWITGRMDDVINVSGHRLGTAEVESAINEHPDVAESAVVGYPHNIKGQGIYAFITLREGVTESDKIFNEIIAVVRRIIGPIATPDKIQWAPGLPKTRSGKIMRRILRKIAARQEEQIGDTSTLADPNVVHDLIQRRGQE